jgi:hypothetical protein
MARDYARIITAIWRSDGEFRQLDSGSQRLYLLLCSQEEISAVGILPLRERRWANLASDTKPDDIRSQLKLLDAGRFLAVDWSTEEVLVRAFTKWDGGFTNPKRRPVILKAAQGIESTRLRRVLASEFVKIGLPTEMLISDSHVDAVPDALPDAVPDAVPDSHPDTLYTESPPVVDRELSSQVDRLSGSLSRNRGVVVTDLGTEEPQPTTQKKQGTGVRTARDSIIADWVAAARKPPPRRVRYDLGRQIDDLLDEGIAQDDIRAGVARWAGTNWAPTSLPAVVNDVMNGEPARPRTNGRPARPTPDDKVRGWQALKDSGPNQIEA